MIKNKTILLICKETFSFTMYFLGKELEKNNKVISNLKKKKKKYLLILIV